MEKHGGRLLELVLYRNILPIQFFILAKEAFRDQTIPIASPVELQDVSGELDAICDCLDINQGL